LELDSKNSIGLDMGTASLRQIFVVEVTEALKGEVQPLLTHSIVMQDEIARRFEIPVGPCEALGIQIALKNQLVPRPLTHDLIHSILARLGGKVESVLIERPASSLRAKIRIQTTAGSYSLEANHGDAIALALRADTPIYATEEVIAK
jgi:uncharacterized protein